MATDTTIATVDGERFYTVHAIWRETTGGQRSHYCDEADWPTTLAGRLAARDTAIAELRELAEVRDAQLQTAFDRATALAGEVAALRRQIATAPVAPPATPRPRHADHGRACVPLGSRPVVPDELPCPECEAAAMQPWRPLMTRHALATHRASTHGYRVDKAAQRHAPGGAVPCPDCDRTFQTASGVRTHRARVHGAQPPPVVAAAAEEEGDPPEAAAVLAAGQQGPAPRAARRQEARGHRRRGHAAGAARGRRAPRRVRPRAAALVLRQLRLQRLHAEPAR